MLQYLVITVTKESVLGISFSRIIGNVNKLN